MRVPFIVLLASLSLSTAWAPGANPDRWHDETYRPQFHFSADKGWLNDPNGLVFYKGEYHLFFQHNPNGTNWVNDLSWGHAVSPDLLHWKYLPEAVPPTPLPDGKMAGSWSGTGFVDFNNSGQFQTGTDKPIIVAWTATNLGQCLAFSNDAGRTFTKFDGNPVIPMAPNRKGDWDRDPDVFWYAPGKHWVLVMSVTGKGYVFHTSTDLRHWTTKSVLPRMFECPNCFELPVDGNAGNRKWVIWDASSKYLIGSFDGERFTPESGPFVLDRGKNYYAAQTWSDAPDGRRIGIGWMRDGKFPGMPFNQQMGIPFELLLRTIPGEGLRLTKYPVKEVESLRYEPKHWENQTMEPGKNLLQGIEGDTFDVEADFAIEKTTQFRFTLRDTSITYADGRLTCGNVSVPVQPIDGHLKIRILLDRTSVEVYANDGAVSLTNAILPSPTDRKMSLASERGAIAIRSISVWRMHSVWNDAQRPSDK